MCYSHLETNTDDVRMCVVIEVLLGVNLLRVPQKEAYVFM